jgi:hypothetical protein
MSDRKWISIRNYGDELTLTEEGCGCCESSSTLDELENKIDELETLERYLKQQLSIVEKAKQSLKEKEE